MGAQSGGAGCAVVFVSVIAGMWWFLAINDAGWWCYPVAVVFSLLAFIGAIAAYYGFRRPQVIDTAESTQEKVRPIEDEFNILRHTAQPKKESNPVVTERAVIPPERTIDDFVEITEYDGVYSATLRCGHPRIASMRIYDFSYYRPMWPVHNGTELLRIDDGSQKYYYRAQKNGIFNRIVACEWLGQIQKVAYGEKLFELDTTEDARKRFEVRQTKERIAAEKRQIAERLKEKERRRKLEKEVRQKLIDSGEITPAAGREPVPRDMVDAVYTRDGGRCVYCGSTEKLQIDHIIPFSKGGADTLENLQILCQRCNIKKSDNIG